MYPCNIKKTIITLKNQELYPEWVLVKNPILMPNYLFPKDIKSVKKKISYLHQNYHLWPRHQGYDIAPLPKFLNDKNSKYVNSPINGFLEYKGQKPGYGKHVIVKNIRQNLSVLIAHLKDLPLYDVGDEIKKNIFLSDMTNHVHIQPYHPYLHPIKEGKLICKTLGRKGIL